MKFDRCGHKKYTAWLGFAIMALGGLMVFIEPIRDVFHGYWHIALVVLGALQGLLAYVKQQIESIPCGGSEDN